jgi:AcrR family transcriptional regulator
MEATTRPLSGRRAQAARNDQRILDAARQVFVADSAAPIAAVADQAGVGMSALYRRYPSKEALLARLAGDGLRRYITEAEAALADDGDPWAAFAGFMGRIVDADTHALVLRLAGTFTPTKDLYDDAERAQSSACGCWSAPRPPAPSAPTWTSTTSPSCSSRWRRSASATQTAPASSATATWGCCWTACTPRHRNRWPVRHPPGRR